MDSVIEAWHALFMQMNEIHYLSFPFRYVTIGCHSAFGISLTGLKYVTMLSCVSLWVLTTRYVIQVFVLFWLVTNGAKVLCVTD